MQSSLFSKMTVAVVVVIALVIIYILVNKASNTPELINNNLTMSSTTQKVVTPIEKRSKTDVKAPKGILHLVNSVTDEDRELGLGGVDSIATDSGMLFTFSEPDSYGFWMQDMKFPIDIVWVDAEKTVIGVDSGVSPDTYPEVYYPNGNVKYVLELNSGVASDYGIEVGTKLVF